MPPPRQESTGRRERRGASTSASPHWCACPPSSAWLWFRLWQWVLVFLIGVFIAIALDPVVRWLERRHLKRAYASPLPVLLIVVVLGAFFYAAGASRMEQARLLGDRLGDAREDVLQALPPENRQSVAQFGGSGARVSDWLQRAAMALTTAVVDLAVALVVAVYSCSTAGARISGVPRSPRAASAREVIAGYVRGNVITSAICAVVTWIVLSALQVPAALLLALLAGILDFVPVVGIFLSAGPAIVLGLTVSSAVGLAVAPFYTVYNIVENYLLQPKVYGRSMRLSDLAVIGGFLVGAELGGVLGALVALPLVAMYPVVERVWAREAEPTRVASEHQRLDAQPEG